MASERTPSEAVRVAAENVKLLASKYGDARVRSYASVKPTVTDDMRAVRQQESLDATVALWAAIDALAALSLHVGDAGDAQSDDVGATPAGSGSALQPPAGASAAIPGAEDGALPALRALVRTILTNAHAFDWSLQGMGMLRLHLPGAYRLHVWDSRYRVPNVSMIHDHLQWGLHSTIIAGELTNRRYVMAAGGEPYVFGTLKPGQGCYFKDGPHPCYLQPLRAITYGPGGEYEQEPAEIHQSDPLDGTVTLMHKRPTADESARVFWPAGEQWVSAEPRRATPEEVAAITSGALERWFGGSASATSARAIVTREGGDPSGAPSPKAIERGPEGARPEVHLTPGYVVTGGHFVESRAQPSPHIEPPKGWKFRAKAGCVVISTPHRGRWTLWPGQHGHQGLLYDLVEALAASPTTPTEGPAQTNPAIRDALERLRFVDRDIWEDIEAALREAKEGHHDAELDELDCTLLLDLLWLYRHAPPESKVRAGTLTDPEGAS